jgi:fatty-acyl-CoA synthase
MRRLGVRHGDRVTWIGPNHPSFLEILFATAKLGAVLSPVNHRLDPDVISQMLEYVEPVALISTGSSPQLHLPPSIRHRIAVGPRVEGAVGYEQLVGDSPDGPIDEPVSLDDLCMLPFTSGTTGLPKGVMLTHGNITWNAVNMVASADFRDDDVTIAITPFFRVGGTGVNVLPTLFKGGAVVVPDTPGPDEILRLIQRRRVTVGFGNPDLLRAMTESSSWRTADLSTLRFVITGGAPVPERLIRACSERGVKLLQGYGLSEAAPAAMLLNYDSALLKPGSAGKPVLMMDARVVRPDGSLCDEGETGELLVSGPNVMAGYWHLPEATARAIDAEGWLHTGDAARIDEEGYFWIVDRVEDRFESSGQVIYPGDVERALARHPAVVDVGVVGVGPAGRQTGAAFVVRDAAMTVTKDDLISFCRKSLQAHQVPGFLTFVDSLPRTSVGKLLRAELRSLAEKHAAL